MKYKPMFWVVYELADDGELLDALGEHFTKARAIAECRLRHRREKDYARHYGVVNMRPIFKLMAKRWAK